MNLRVSLLAAVASIGLVAAANASPVTGQISIAGVAQAIGSTGMGGATGIDFLGGPTGSTAGGLTQYGGTNTAPTGTGSFAALGQCSSSSGACGTIKDIGNYLTAAPISQFITFTTGTSTQVSFDLSSITEWAPTSSDNTLRITALGTINFTGYDSTAGVFTLTAQGNSIVSFSATTLAAATTVPEPASLALLGLTLAGVGLLRRQKA